MDADLFTYAHARPIRLNRNRTDLLQTSYRNPNKRRIADTITNTIAMGYRRVRQPSESYRWIPAFASTPTSFMPRR
jgi:hypothetical protein